MKSARPQDGKNAPSQKNILPERGAQASGTNVRPLPASCP